MPVTLYNSEYTHGGSSLPAQNGNSGKILSTDGTTLSWITIGGTNSGTNTGDQTITLTGDVTGSGTGSFAATIANNAVSLAKMATVSSQTFLGRNTAATGNVESLSASTVVTMLALTENVRFTINGQGSTITTGTNKAWLKFDFACTIIGVTTDIDQSGSIVLDLQKTASFPTGYASIVASAPPTISSAQTATDTTLTGWGSGKTIAAGDRIRVDVTSVTSAQICVCTLKLTRS